MLVPLISHPRVEEVLACQQFLVIYLKELDLAPVEVSRPNVVPTSIGFQSTSASSVAPPSFFSNANAHIRSSETPFLLVKITLAGSQGSQ